MKKMTKVLASVVCLVMCLFAFAGCSSYGSIVKAFEKEGYEVVTTDSDKSGVTFGEDVNVTVHTLKKDLSVVWIFEFGSSDELNKQLEENETLKGAIKDAQKSDAVNGNCICFTLDVLNAKKIYEIFKNA